MLLALVALALPIGSVCAGGVAVHSRDPYIRMHADDLVDWQDWGPAAFRQAERENKPIFLSVGFLSCLYCHIEEQETFRDPRVTAFMNKHFVNVIVNRERLPQVDRIYQIAQRQMRQQVAWPNSMVLTPQRLPFAGGGYFPLISNAPRQLDFNQMIVQAEAEWRLHPETAKAKARQILQQMQRQVRSDAGSGSVTPRQWLDQSLDYWDDLYDRAYGGFADDDSKFPNAPVLSMLLAVVAQPGDSTTGTDARMERFREELQHSLDEMASGTLMDHVNGGFRRYTTDAQWNHPHQEKMLDSNALLLSVYAQAARTFDEPYYDLVARQTGSFLTRRFLSAEGGFFNSIGPRVSSAGGDRPRLSEKLIAETLGPEAAARFLKVYVLVPIAEPTDEELFAGEVPGFLRLQKIETARVGRVPGSVRVDTIMAEDAAITKLRARLASQPDVVAEPVRVAATNGLAIAALAQAGAMLHQESWVDTATEAAQWLWDHLYVEHGTTGRQLWHQLSLGEVQGEGTLEDYANVGMAFMSVYEVTGDRTWLDRAQQIAQQLRVTFQRPNGLLVSVADPSYLILEPVSTGDDQTPSATTQAVRLFLAIHRATGQQTCRTAADVALGAVAGRISATPGQWPALVAVAQALAPVEQRK